jgi:NAD(P)-dependent dehydrogenase (short-subunit alcohol dehydrogenase family)
MALQLAAKERDIILTYHAKEDEAQAVVAQIEAMGRRAVALQLDVSQSGTFDAFAGRVKESLQTTWNRDSFDFLVNNAGVGLHASFAETTEEQFDQMVNIHFKGVFFLTQKLLPLLIDDGRIVNISSGLSRFSYENYSAYASNKGAVEVLSRYLAKELGPRGIAVNVVAPGAIETDFGGGVVRDNEQLNQMLASQTALGRVGLPTDIGGVVASLLSDEMGWVNGQRIEVTGGINL